MNAWSLKRTAAAALIAAALLGLAACRDKGKRGSGTAGTEPASTEHSAKAQSLWWIGTGVSFSPISTDGGEDFVGLCADQGPGSPVSFCAFSGTSFELLWRSKPLADHENGYTMQHGIAGSHAVVVDHLGVAHIFDIASGRESGSAKLGERAKLVCNPSEHKSKLWIALATGDGVLLDPLRASATRAARPKSCAPKRWETTTLSPCKWHVDDNSAACKEYAEPPKVEDFSPKVVAIDGQHGVALGGHTRGTEYPMLVGFNAVRGESGPLRWKRPVFPGNPLAGPSESGHLAIGGGRAVVAYEAGGHHLVAISVTDGKTLWDVPTSSVSYFEVSPTRVYVMRFTRVEVRDAKTGNLLGGVGVR